MPLTQNQLDDQFKKTLQRPATPYEYNIYKNSSLQDLAQIDRRYSALNKDTSIVDYLKYTGQDPKSIKALGLQHGITNVGTAEGNLALLRALKGGTDQTTTPPTNASQGSIPAASGDVAGDSTTTQDTPGSVSEASDSSPFTPPPVASSYTPPPQDPAIASTRNQYTSVQKQISDIDLALASELDKKKQQVVASGGIVNDAQLMGLVQQEQAPLVIQRRELAAQQATLGKTYQQLLAADKQAQTEAYQAATLKEKADTTNATLGQRGSIAQAADSAKAKSLAEKTAVDATKLAQTRQRIEKVAVYDQSGSKTGDSLVLVDPVTGKTTQLTTNADGSLTPGSVKKVLNGNSTLQDFFNVYAPAADKNDPVAYTNAVAHQMGIDPGTLITDLAGKEKDLANAIATHEGFFNGTSTIAIQGNNPGALKFANQPGALKGNGGFAHFDTISDGWGALINDIHSKIAIAYNLSPSDFDTARSLSRGELGLTAFNKVLGGLSAKGSVIERRQNILKLAHQLNPNFVESQFEQGQKFGANANTQKTLAAIDAVENTFGIISGLVDQAVNTGIPILNKIVMPGVISVGNVKTSNFATVATALADELSGVLGYGSATDMKLQLGIDLTTPTQSPEQFKTNLQYVEQLVENRKTGINKQIWQGTGSQGGGVGGGSSNQNDPLGIR